MQCTRPHPSTQWCCSIMSLHGTTALHETGALMQGRGTHTDGHRGLPPHSPCCCPGGGHDPPRGARHHYPVREGNQAQQQPNRHSHTPSRRCCTAKRQAAHIIDDKPISLEGSALFSTTASSTHSLPSHTPPPLACKQACEISKERASWADAKQKLVTCREPVCG